MATRTWDGGAANDNWSDILNWDGVVPVAGDDLVFAGGTRLTPNNDIAAATSFASITFSSGAGAFVIGGNSITLTGSITNNDADLQTINLAIITTGVRTVNAASGNITLGGVVSGSGGGITKTGTNSLTVSATNTYTGSTTITAGTFVLTAVTNITSTGSIVLNGGTLDHLGAGTITNALSVTATSTITSADGDDITWSGTISWSAGILNLRITGAGTHSNTFSSTSFSYAGEINVGTGCNFGLSNGGGTATLSGFVSGTGGISLTGGGTKVFSGANTTTGACTINGAGTLEITGSFAGAVTPSATSTIRGNGTVSGAIVCSGTANIAPGVGGGTAIGTLTTAAVTFIAGTPYNVNLSSSGPTADRITSSGTVTLAGVLNVNSLAGGNRVGTVFTILSATTVSGTFSNRANNSIFVAAGGTFRIVYTSTTVTLTMLARRGQGFMAAFGVQAAS